MWPFSKKTAVAKPAPKAAPAIDPEMIEQAHNAVGWLVDYLDGHTLMQEIRDVKELPADRTTMVNAFCVAMGVEPDVERRNAMLIMGLELSSFQPNIGKPITQMPANIDMSDMNGTLEKMTAHASENARFAAIHPTVQQDMEEMAGWFQTALDIAQKRFG